MPNNKAQFKKESLLAKARLTMEQLQFYRAKSAARLTFVKTAGLFGPQDIKRVEDTIADYDSRIARRKTKIVREAQRMVKQAISQAS